MYSYLNRERHSISYWAFLQVKELLSSNRFYFLEIVKIIITAIAILIIFLFSNSKLHADGESEYRVCETNVDLSTYKFFQYLFGPFDRLVLRNLPAGEGTSRILFLNLLNKNDRFVDFYHPSYVTGRNLPKITATYIDSNGINSINDMLECTIDGNNGCRSLAAVIVPRKFSDVTWHVEYEITVLETLLLKSGYEFSVVSVDRNCTFLTASPSEDEIGVTIVYVNPNANADESANCVATGYARSLGYRGVIELYQDRQSISQSIDGYYMTNVGRVFTLPIIQEFEGGSAKTGMTKCDYMLLRGGR